MTRKTLFDEETRLWKQHKLFRAYGYVKDELVKQREILREMEKDLADPHTSEIIRLTRKGQVDAKREEVKHLEEALENLNPIVKVKFT